MGIEVRTIVDDELGPWLDAVARGFLAVPDPGSLAARRGTMALDRSWAAIDGDRIIGTLRSFATDLTMPGGRPVPAAALTSVTVTATHRRRGVLTEMIERDLRASAERGEAAGVLIASEHPIYGRFGYGPATEHATLTIDTRRARLSAAALEVASGDVELVDGRTWLGLAPPVFERHRLTSPGEIRRTTFRWEVDSGVRVLPADEHDASKNHYVLCRDGSGEVTGYAVYTVDRSWQGRVPNGTIKVGELIGVDRAATLRLWSYLMSVDWVGRLEAPDRAVDDPLPLFLTDARGVQESFRSDFLWVRPFDVSRLLAARTYLTAGHVVLEVVDPLGLASGRYELDGDRHGATCRPTTAAAHVTVPAASLGSVVLGGVTLRRLAAAGRADIHDERGYLAADAMLRGAEVPFCATWF